MGRYDEDIEALKSDLREAMFRRDALELTDPLRKTHQDRCTDLSYRLSAWEQVTPRLDELCAQIAQVRADVARTQGRARQACEAWSTTTKWAVGLGLLSGGVALLFGVVWLWVLVVLSAAGSVGAWLQPHRVQQAADDENAPQHQKETSLAREYRGLHPDGEDPPRKL